MIIKSKDKITKSDKIKIWNFEIIEIEINNLSNSDEFLKIHQIVGLWIRLIMKLNPKYEYKPV